MTTFSNHIECSEAIAGYLVRNVTAPWRLIEVVVKVQHDIEMVTAELIYYPSAPPGAKKKWFGIEDASEDVEFGRCFVELAKLTSTAGHGLFKRCKFTLEPNGKYRTEYEY